MDAVQEYDFTSRTGTLFVNDGSSCDMMGCIDLFKKIDPAVKHIRTIAGSKEDTGYTLSPMEIGEHV